MNGVRFVDDGLTDEVPRTTRPAYDRARWGERWAPLLVAWMPPSATDIALDDRVEGATLPVVVPGRGGPSILSAQVVLNADLLLPPGFGPGLTQGEVLLHELGHALGLAHVSAPGSIMYPTVGAGPAVLSDGDRAGLAALGAPAGCHPAPTPQPVGVRTGG